jgi:hypothetical protein
MHIGYIDYFKILYFIFTRILQLTYFIFSRNFKLLQNVMISPRNLRLIYHKNQDICGI